MARELDLGTCWIGSAQSWLATAEGRATLGLEDTLTPMAAIIIGHPRSVPDPVPRKAANIRWIDA